MTSSWSIETTDRFDREFRKLDHLVQRRVLAYLHDVGSLEDPRRQGKGLTAIHAGVWRYQVGDYRILAQLIDDTMTVLELRGGHRRDVY